MKRRILRNLVTFLCAISMILHLFVPIVFKEERIDVFAASKVEPSAVFEENYAKAGEPLTVAILNAPEDMECSYKWYVGDQLRAAITGNSYIPTESDNENFIKVVVSAKNYDWTWELSMYMSKLPVVYIDTEDGQDVMKKDEYKDANIRIQGNDQFCSEEVLYDGLTEIKGRGNSTWDYSASNNLKKPYRLKFDKKADVLGMGKSKHWILLANVKENGTILAQQANTARAEAAAIIERFMGAYAE